MSATNSEDMFSRPISRRGAKESDRQMSAVPTDRPMTGIVRPPSTTVIKGTGLKPIGTGAAGVSHRQVQDRSYFMGLIRSAMGELTSEISKLKGQSEEIKAEKAASQVFEKRVRELAEELTGLQEQLSDYNLLVDRLNTGAEVSDVNLEIADVAHESEKISKEVESLFAKKQTLEDESNELKEKLKQEQHITEKLVLQLDMEGQDKFARLQLNTTKLDAKADELQAQLDAMNAEMKELEEKIAQSEIHKESLRLQRRLHDLTVRRDALAEEERNRQSPGQQRDSLLAAVKSHNAELAALDAQSEREKQAILVLQNSISQATQALEQNNSDRTSQYSELKKKEAAIEEFLSGFELAMQQEQARRNELEKEVVTALQSYSALLEKTQNLPSLEAYGELKEQLGLKEGEVEKAKFTTQGLNQQEAHLKSQMTRVLELEEKVTRETENLRSKMKEMETEQLRLSDLQGLKGKEEERKKQLEIQKNQAQKDMQEKQLLLKSAREKYISLEKALLENDVWTQLNHLEHKWSQAAQNNQALTDYITAHQTQSDYKSIKDRAMNMVEQYNQFLKTAQIRPNN
ncbi:Hypothetical predicted protein [Cloeon dipterum]|uniref:Uncharacterized protein n=1 Tax=Cloeon dipterum TaxID=197152 RepID=A0A8S1C8D6_9INSE|nr:Hypothetical predicted protein [Cloeon dipterum]